jgi:UDP-glucose 4-epimerase
MSTATVLVTGGTGWLGTQLVPALVRLGHGVRVYSRSQDKARRFDHALGPVAASVDVQSGDITDRVSLKAALRGVNVVFHLAAEKAIDRCERDPLAAVRTNVLGTLILQELAHSVGVSRIIAASTDKASEPGSVLGTTKLLMERILISASAEPPSAAVRLGGLLQSSESVLQRWRRTAAEGYIEVSDPNMTRFAMTTAEAVELLMGEAAHSERQIVAKALPAYRLGDLASVFAAQYRARIVVVGPRLGERTHEALISEAEAPFARRDGNLFVITPGQRQVGIAPYSSRDALRLNAADLDGRIALETNDA